MQLIASYPVIALLLLTVVCPTLFWFGLFAFPGTSVRMAKWVRRSLDRLASRRRTVVVGSAVLVLAIRVLLLPLWPVPRPSVLDEFSYLLLGETFALGRLANPPHPLWQHFETLFVLQQPAYASVYPVMQGLFLAVGQVLFGEPWWGVWLSVGLMCGAVSWAIHGWLPPRWAILGILWVSLQLALTTYWMNSYWGGAVSATGGALLAGAVARMRRRVQWKHSLIFAIGLAMMANSRPYEGLLVACVTTGWLGVRIARRWPGWSHIWRQLVLTVSCVVLLTGLAMANYFAHVTGSSWKLPYQAYAEQYAASPAFFWQKLPPEPEYRHAELRLAHLALRDEYRQFERLETAVSYTLYKLRLLGSFYLGPLVFVPLLTILPVLRSRAGPALVVVLVTLAGILLAVPIQPHYGAPLTAFLVIVTVQALRFFWLARRRANPVGSFLVPSAPVVCAAYILLSAISVRPPGVLSARPGVIDLLLKKGGQHLVIVRYGLEHSLAEEWVYNSADIDGAPIVWARDMGPDRNLELLRYYPRRAYWLLLPDSGTTQLVPYGEPSSTAASTGSKGAR